VYGIGNQLSEDPALTDARPSLSETAASDADVRAAAQKFPETTKQVVDFYMTTANDDEKRVIAQAVRQANRTIKQETRGDAGDDGEEQGKKKKKKKGQPSPEDLAAALYGILGQDEEAVVRGDPRDGDETRIRGQFDLNEVARKLLALA
jgi:hypothetical protein